MTIENIKQNLTQGMDAFKRVVEKISPDNLKARLNTLEPETSKQGFWKDQGHAKLIMRELQNIKYKLGSLESINTEFEEANTLIQLFEENTSEPSKQEQEELSQMVSKILESIANLEMSTYLGGKYDASDAILSIHAGQGGTEACDWAQMLARMYTRYFERQKWKYEIIDEVRGTEAGLSSISFEVYGDYAYGYLKNEHGTHRLVRVSPFNAQGLRQTSFAGVEVMPIIDEDLEVNLKPEDVEFSAVRSSGAGGQNVNKVATSVRLLHLPTGIIVTCSTSRSQYQNKEAATRMLRAKLFQIEKEKLDEEKSKLKGEHKIAGWGNQIRNYVLQPYKLVKDLRTKVETEQTGNVLDGELDEFIKAEIRL